MNTNLEFLLVTRTKDYLTHSICNSIGCFFLLITTIVWVSLQLNKPPLLPLSKQPVPVCILSMVVICSLSCICAIVLSVRTRILLHQGRYEISIFFSRLLLILNLMIDILALFCFNYIILTLL